VVPQNDFHSEELIIDEPAVAAHEGHHVEDRSQLEEGSDGEEHQSMTHVAEHHSEQDGDSREHEDRGQDFIVFGN
jgi:hypothetical protein